MLNPEGIKSVTKDTVLFWHRRDLRLTDNTGLYHALRENKNVQPVFIFDTVILSRLEDKDDARVTFIHESLRILTSDLQQLGSSLLVLYGDPIELFSQLEPAAVYTNHDYEPYALKRDAAVGKILRKKGIPFLTYKDHVIFEKSEIVKKDGTPYSVFTPYSRQWREALTPERYRAFPFDKFADSLKKNRYLPFPKLADIGFTKTRVELPGRVIRKSIIKDYEKTRDIPALAGTSRLGVHIRFGTLSIRSLVRLAVQTNQTWLNELIWREFFAMILFHYPSVEHQPFKSAYGNIEWLNNENDFRLWCDGKTGFPLVDAGMRELNQTGFMHNRVRMVAASFLVKHLLIDWRWGEAYFARKLLDFDLASNNGGWQWAAGSGCDAAPYFRVFNPLLQQQKFDGGEQYIRRWIPEYGTSDYPKPIVEHAYARDRVIHIYKKALGG